MFCYAVIYSTVSQLILKIGKNETLGDWLDSLGERREYGIKKKKKLT